MFRARAWFIAGWITVGGIVGLALLAGPSSIVACTTQVREVPEPEGWRAWPVTSESSMGGLGVCPDSSVTRVTRALAEATVAPRVDRRVWLRQNRDQGLVVIASVPTAQEAPSERFVLAFHAEHGRRLAFASRGAAAGAGVLGLSMALMLTGLVVARRRLRPAASREGASVSHGAAPYRRSTRPEAPDGTDAARSASAIEALRSSLLAVAAVLGVSAVVAGGLLVREVLRTLL